MNNPTQPFVLTKEFLEIFKNAVESKNDVYVNEITTGLFPADISTLLDEIDADGCKYVLDLLDKDVRADIISDLDPDIRKTFLKIYSPKEIAEFIDYTDSDDAVDILNELPIQLREEAIAYIKDEEKSSHITDLLRYDEDCAGGLMAKEFIAVKIHWTTVQCIEEIRRQAEKVEKIHTIYVVDEQNVLKGRLSVKKLLLSDDKTQIEDIYSQDIIAVYSYDHEEDIANIMQKYDLESVPVINKQRQLLGRITVDDIIDVITELAELNQQAMAGISEDVEEADSVLKLSRARLPWLFIGMVGGLLGAQFMELFEKDLIAVPAMAFFIPLITATGGNVGIQSATLVVQALSGSSIQDTVGQRLFKSLLVALLNGIVIATSVFLMNWLFTMNMKLSLIVAIALFCVVLIASIMGTITPIVLNKAGINPAIASGPFITTANDLVGLAVYFSVARLLYGLA
ncbi:MAG: magnesium transporter [Bernardetiaceae bacterium]|nr:magnesium transporter [Bernardetiaceae bacterium]